MEGLYGKYPRIDKELILQYHKGLIATTCCLGASVPKTILKKGKRKAKRNSNGGWTSSARTSTWKCNATAFPNRRKK